MKMLDILGLIESNLYFELMLNLYTKKRLPWHIIGDQKKNGVICILWMKGIS